MTSDVIRHYDELIDEGNDPVCDPAPLREYMDKWDGPAFIDELKLSAEKSVLEIGVGTGRLALRTAPLCGDFCGIDISPKTVERARQNLAGQKNVTLICGDFLTFNFPHSFDVIYSSLTFMHIRDKQAALQKAASLLNKDGLFVLSIDKNRSKFIDTGTRKVTVYPDNLDDTEKYMRLSGLDIRRKYETEFAYIISAQK